MAGYLRCGRIPVVCVKGYSRLQTVVALSSAEAELFAIAEVAKEVAGLGQLASHIWGELTKPLAIYTDSASARQIAGMEGVPSEDAACRHQTLLYSGQGASTRVGY